MKSGLTVKNDPNRPIITASFITPTEVNITPKSIENHNDFIIIKVDDWYNVKIAKNQAF